MTKDRRLGRGLAALLGTPLEEDQIVEGSVRSFEPASQARSATNPPPTSGSERPPQRTPAVAGPTPSRPGVTGAVPLHTEQVHTEQVHTGQVHTEQVHTEQVHTAQGTRPQTLELSVYEIDNNPFQPRRKFHEEEIASLAESIREHEQLQPVLVRRVGNRYQLISGERRLRATIHAGLTTIRAEVRQADDRLVAELAIVENLQRKDLDAIEKALSFRRYIDEHKCRQDDLAKRLKIDRSTIANLMRLLELPKQIQEWVQDDKLSAGHARTLLPLGDERQQMDFARQIMEDGWSVRDTERRVSERLKEEDGGGKGSGSTGSKPKVSPHIAALEQQLRLALGTKIEIRQSTSGRGKITISFANTDEFDRIRGSICPEASSRVA